MCVSGWFVLKVDKLKVDEFNIRSTWLLRRDLAAAVVAQGAPLIVSLNPYRLTLAKLLALMDDANLFT